MGVDSARPRYVSLYPYLCSRSEHNSCSAHLQWIGTTLHEACSSMPPHLVLDARVYVSGSMQDVPVLPVAPESDDDISTPSTVLDDNDKKLEDPIIRFVGYQTKPGRPDIYRLLEEINAAEGRVSVSGEYFST
jgi:hypothetical protein